MNLILIIGRTGEGKTPWVSQQMANSFRPNPANPNKSIQTVSSASKKQYVFDINNEYDFSTDQKYSPQMRHTGGDQKRFIEVCKTLRNTNIIFEDASGFLRGRQDKEFARLLYQKKHSGNNYVILFHSIERVPPEIMETAELIVLFRTGDNLESINKKFHSEKLNFAFLTLQKNPATKFLKLKNNV